MGMDYATVSVAGRRLDGRAAKIPAPSAAHQCCLKRTWFLLSPDATSAEKVEHQLTSGERVHFGFDADIMGMICNSGDHLNTINVPMRTIMQLCVKAGFELAPWSKPREKQQDYEIVSKSSTNSSSTPGSCT